ncbi:MAG: hypothetical protein EA396_12495 [Anaerolineaceae bacterium]|nr:MAG: hypothetical protein EA396_12495 [Anaerolineaceae bacterium]
MRRRSAIGFVLAVLLASGIFLMPERGLGLSAEEGAALWAVRDDVRYDVAPRDIPRHIRADWVLFGERATTLTQPPLYFALLNGWTRIAGESPFAVRWLSMLWVIVGLAASVALARRIERGGRGWLAVLVGAFCLIYAATAAYTYAQTFALVALGAWLLTRDSSHRLSRRTLTAYALTLTALFYTHHVAAPAVLVHGGLLWWTRRGDPSATRDSLRGWLMAVGVAGLAFIPYLVRFAPPELPALRETVIALALVALPVILAGAVRGVALAERSAYPAVRGLLPALIIALAFVLGIGANTLAMRDHPDWAAFIAALTTEREPLQAGVVVLPPQHPLWHYDRQPSTAWRRGVLVDLGWGAQTPESARDVLERLRTTPRWAMLSASHANSAIIREQFPPESALIKTIGDTRLWRLD